LKFEFVPENRRRQLTVADKQRILVTTSWTLKITCTVTASSSSYQQISSTYIATISATSTSSLISGLNSACGCTAYSSISIDSYGVENISNDEDKSNENLALLSILVLLIVPITFAFYYVKITYYPVKNSETAAAADVADIEIELNKQDTNASVTNASGETCIVVNDDALIKV